MFIALNESTGEFLKGPSLQNIYDEMTEECLDWQDYEFYELGEEFTVEAVLIRKNTIIRKEK